MHALSEDWPGNIGPSLLFNWTSFHHIFGFFPWILGSLLHPGLPSPLRAGCLFKGMRTGEDGKGRACIRFRTHFYQSLSRHHFPAKMTKTLACFDFLPHSPKLQVTWSKQLMILSGFIISAKPSPIAWFLLAGARTVRWPWGRQDDCLSP